MSGFRTAISRGLESVATDRRGASAVEFSLLLPVLVTLYLGGIGLSQVISIDRKVTALARALGDLVAKSDAVNTVELASYGGLSPVVLAPAPAKGAVMTTVAVWTDENLNSTVDWSYRSFGEGAAVGSDPLPSKGAAYSLPNGLASKSSQTIVTIVDYPYAPGFGAGLTGTIEMNETLYLKPRNGKCVKNTDSGHGGCGARSRL